jgi:hypothetical protein
MLLVATPAFANDLLVEPRTIKTNDLLTITVSLEGPAASAEGVDLPLRNLRIVGEPWVSSEFAWINGETIRRKVFRYRARPVAAGIAVVGPLTIEGETFGPIEVQVVADRASGSNEPLTVLRELLATGRDPFFVVAQVDRANVFAGEQVVVTWTLYNAASVQQWQIVEVPKLEDFWSEEIDVRNATPEQVLVGETFMQRVPIRRVALFPLRSGRLRIGGVTLEAAIMRRIRRGPFSMFEGNLIEGNFTSAPLELDVQPLPPGPAVGATGTYALDCTQPVQRNGGPVVVQVALSGRGNVRAATAPRFAGNLAAQVELVPGTVTAAKDRATIEMTRRWTYLLFPARSGTLAIPDLTLLTFDPAAGARRELRCSGRTLDVQAAAQPLTEAPPAEVSRDAAERKYVPWIAGAVLLALIGGLAIPRLRRTLRLRREVRQILGDGLPAGIRQRVEARVDGAKLLTESSDRGDAYRALRSILDAAEQERDIAVNADDEIARRVRELLTIAG